MFNNLIWPLKTSEDWGINMNIEITNKQPRDMEHFAVDKATREKSDDLAVRHAMPNSEVEKQEKTTEEQDVKVAEKFEPKDIATVVDELNEAIPLRARQLQFAIDEGANRTVISVLDKESGETIRQIPSKEALELVIRLREAAENNEQTVGVLVDSKI